MLVVKSCEKSALLSLNIFSYSNHGKMRMLNLSMQCCTVSVSYLKTTCRLPVGSEDDWVRELREK